MTDKESMTSIKTAAISNKYLQLSIWSIYVDKTLGKSW